MKDAVHRRLLDRLRPDTSATGEVRRVLATTHDLDALFFDSDFLCTALSIPQAEFAGASGQLALQRKLAALHYAGVLCEAAAFQARPNLRTAVYPVGLRGARLHAKLVVIEYEHAVRLLVGSANLTNAGYRSNREIAGELVAKRGDVASAAQAAAVLRAAVEALGVFEDRAEEFLTELRGLTTRLVEWAQGMSAESPVVWSDGARPLHRSLLARWPAGSKVERVRVVSPFWCEDGSSDTPLRRLLRELSERGVLAERCDVELFVEGVTLPGGGCGPKEPLSFYFRDFSGVAVRVIPVSPAVDPAELDVKIELTAARCLHAKVLVLESGQGALAYAGSANFTRRGFGLRKAAADGSMAANIEAGWAFDLELRAVRTLLPPAGSDGQLLPSVAEPGAPAAADDDEAVRFWPSALMSVELGHSNGGETPELTARLDASAPAGWRIRVPNDGEHDSDGDELFTTAGGAALLRVPLSLGQFRSLLRERHVLVVAPEGEAPFPINIAAGEARDRLPLASGTTVPSESELLDYYQGRLTFEDLFADADALYARDTSEANARDGGVDKSRIQAYQLRAFVDALPGLRNELRGLSGSRGVLYQGFLGDVSPAAIARAVAKQVEEGRRSPTAGAFQLVELIALLDGLAGASPTEHYDEFRGRARDHVRSLLQALRARHVAELSDASAFARYEARLCREVRA